MNPNPMRTALVITSISAPNTALRELAAGAIRHGWDFVLAGDSKSPPDFLLEGCRFLSLEDQRRSGFSLAGIAPEKSYTRKNIAYLDAMRAGSKVIVETDDDNRPMPSFWSQRVPQVEARAIEADGWVNIYQYFGSGFIYPRGLPLNAARQAGPPPSGIRSEECPIQQGLANEDPDVDAVYRMLYPLPFHFETDPGPLLLRNGAWCPFNSQNTTFFKPAFPLLYLPAHCSFRMTDIWRSFVAQRVLHALGQGILFHAPTVYQERNEHDLMRDFEQELPGYLHNAAIRQALLEIPMGRDESIRCLMEKCYGKLIRMSLVASGEEMLLKAWFEDLEGLGIA